MCFGGLYLRSGRGFGCRDEIKITRMVSIKKHVRFMLTLSIIVVALIIVGMSLVELLRRPNVVDGEVRLPFEDGQFIISYEELNEGRFSFGYARWPDTPLGRHDVLDDIQLRFYGQHGKFIEIMNDISPVLIEAVITDDSNPYRDRFAPFSFDVISEDDPLYALHGWDFFLRMYIHQTPYSGYLSFYIFESGLLITDEYVHILDYHLGHRSLYKITLDELEKIISFAESLDSRGGIIHVSVMHRASYIYRRTIEFISMLLYDIRQVTTP